MTHKFFIIPLDEVLKRSDTIKYPNGARIDDNGLRYTYNYTMNNYIKEAGLFGKLVLFEKWMHDCWWTSKAIKNHLYKWHESWLSIYPPPGYKMPRVVVHRRSFVSYIEL